MAAATELTYTFLMPAGATVELVKLNSGILFPSYCWATVDDPQTGLGGRYELSVEQGKPILRRFTVDVAPPHPPLTAQMIRTMSAKPVLDQIVTRAAQVAARHGLTGGYQPSGEAYSLLGPQERAELAELGQRAAEGRRVWRAVTPQLLAQVAEIVRANPDRPNKAIQEQLHTSKRNATRWIALAHKSEEN